jgi:phosphoglycolate phosphatase-like HAD superfamily hydrolase
MQVNELLSAYSAETLSGLHGCQVAPGLDKFRELTRKARWHIVSGGDQTELRALFRHRGLTPYFDGGIFGSPASKNIIFAREIEVGNILLPAVYIGDSRYDHSAAKGAGLDFFFLSQWTELDNWREWVVTNRISFADNIGALIELTCAENGRSLQDFKGQ